MTGGDGKISSKEGSFSIRHQCLWTIDERFVRSGWKLTTNGILFVYAVFTLYSNRFIRSFSSALTKASYNILNKCSVWVVPNGGLFFIPEDKRERERDYECTSHELLKLMDLMRETEKDQIKNLETIQFIKNHIIDRTSINMLNVYSNFM